MSGSCAGWGKLCASYPYAEDVLRKTGRNAEFLISVQGRVPLGEIGINMNMFQYGTPYCSI